jgi:predicted homoserine dehydrogenase-like protein
MGLAHGVRLRREVGEGRPIRWVDAEVDENSLAVRVRREMEGNTEYRIQNTEYRIQEKSVRL